MKTPSSSIQDYLKAIYALEEECSPAPVTTSLLADRLGVSRPSVTGMLQKMASASPKLVEYLRYQGVRLTPAGTKVALEVIRHHRLIESYLSKALDFPWDEVHHEADLLEHVISEALEARIAEKLGHPELDPHGQPIPRRDGTVSQRGEVRLSELHPGAVAVVCRVSDQDPDILRYLDQLGIHLSTRIEVTDRAPFDGPLHVRLDSQATHALGRKVTDRVYVLQVKEESRS
ncbi:MAG TPA: metal-dependent transcriptional regulator [Anaerolineales bacterium]|nr:metal-dependent transcriptional regulator [Anaerolineales bacterium]